MFDVRGYIESGVLEAYVSGMLDPADAKEVEAHRVAYPEVEAEVRAIEQALKKFAELNSPEIPNSLKNDIWAKLEQEQPAVSKRPEAKVLQMAGPDSNVGFYKYLVAASVVGLLLSLAGNYYLYGQWQRTQNELASAKTSNSVLAQDLQTSKASYQLANNQLVVMKNPNNKVVHMQGLEIAPKAFAVVYWDSSAHKTFIDPGALPVPPTGKQYQLWAIADGKPVDAGVFVVDTASQNIQPVKDISAAQMFAVTLEPTGGSAVPTMTSMYVAGKLL